MAQEAQSTGGENIGASPSLVALTARVVILEDNVYKLNYWASISASSGTITAPTGSTILLDQVAGGVDALLSTIDTGIPTGDLPQTAGLADVDVATFDASGNYTLDGTPSAYPVALIYWISIPADLFYTLDIDYTLVGQIDRAGSDLSQLFVQDGNSFAEDAVLGTNDTFSLIFKTDNTTAITIDSSQNVEFDGLLAINTTPSATAKLLINAVTTNDSLAEVLIGTSATTQKALVLQATGIQTVNMFEVQNSAGAAVTSIDYLGNINAFTCNLQYNSSAPILTAISSAGAGTVTLGCTANNTSTRIQYLAKNSSGASRTWYTGTKLVGTADTFSLYQEQANFNAWTVDFSGNFGLKNVIAPTARLHLPAGTATASTAPLKFTAGVVLTTPEVGVIEYITGAFVIQSDNLRIGGQVYQTSLPANTVTANASTIDWDNGNLQSLDLAAATGTVTVTLSNPQVTCYTIKVIQKAASPVDITWPGTVKWLNGGATPVISTGASAIDTYALIWDGSSYLGTYVKDYQ